MAAHSLVTAVLGPTNTGKTYHALDRMLGYRSGMIGFPLRLLARENYERLVRQKGPHAIALLTGEEKILPKRPQYYVCTVEAMPQSLSLEFIGIDEIQLAADPERGHVFTDRLLNMRGLEETMFMGAMSAKGLIQRLVPQTQFISKPRFSDLAHVRSKKMSQLPARSAVIAFSAQQVYATASMMRAHKGGAAVVLGGLSPRTRNAQVALYQSGELDYIVATDAIGMGLNMDLNHVCFSSLSKFDGQSNRALTSAELGQIAGRAGRYTQNGSFSTLSGTPALSTEQIEAIENHNYPDLTHFVWRNSALDFSSISRLLYSLDAPAPLPCLSKGREADDLRALRALSKDSKISAQAQSTAALRLLWDTCQIPDFHKTLTDSHLRLIKTIYGYLLSPTERIPEQWAAAQIERLDDMSGDIDALMNRLSNIRTWTYISHHSQWLEQSHYWQEMSAAIEDRLSDQLHIQLTNLFVDRRAQAVMKQPKGELPVVLLDSHAQRGQLQVYGQNIGEIRGLNFSAASHLQAREAKASLSRIKQSLQGVVLDYFDAITRSDNQSKLDFIIQTSAETAQVLLRYDGVPIARLQRSDQLLAPSLTLLPSDLLALFANQETLRTRLQSQLQTWLEGHCRARLQGLDKLDRLAQSSSHSATRALAFQLLQGMGMLRLDAEKRALLDERARNELSAQGVILGAHLLWLPLVAKPKTRALRAWLWGLYQQKLACVLPFMPAQSDQPPLNCAAAIKDDTIAFSLQSTASDDEFSLLAALGFVVLTAISRKTMPPLQARAHKSAKPASSFLRVDSFEKFAQAAALCAQQNRACEDKPAYSNQVMRSLVHNDSSMLKAALKACGYTLVAPKSAQEDGAWGFYKKTFARKKAPVKKRPKTTKTTNNSAAKKTDEP